MNPRKATARQWLRHALITQWRGVPDGPLVDCPIVNVAELAPKIVAQCGISERLKLDEVVSAWRGTVGDFIANHSQPDSITRGVLTVRVIQPAVHHALMMEKPAILRRLVAALGANAIKDIRFRHG